MLSRRLLLIGLTAAVPASAQAPDRASLAEHAARRYPQPVRVGDLIGREVLEPKESQTVLGRVAAIRRAQDGGIDLVMRYGGLLGFGTRLISVPIEAVALLGEYVAMVGLTPCPPHRSKGRRSAPTKRSVSGLCARSISATLPA
jgi:hypothetical protein